MDWSGWSEWWGSRDWPETRAWVIAFVGLVALGVATATYAMNSKEKRESQARKVWVEQSGSSRTELWLRQVDGSFLRMGAERPRWRDRACDSAPGDERIKDVTRWVIHNDGDELIDQVQLEIELHHQDGRAAEAHRREQPPLPPKGVSTAEIDLWDTHSGDLVRCSVLFRDPSGRHWRRRDATPLERVRRVRASRPAMVEHMRRRVWPWLSTRRRRGTSDPAAQTSTG